MDETIGDLDAETAVRILLTIAKAETRRGGYETSMNAELGTALSETLGGPEVSAPPADGELARQALLLLSEDPVRRATIEALIHEPPPEHFGVGRIYRHWHATRRIQQFQRRQRCQRRPLR